MYPRPRPLGSKEATTGLHEVATFAAEVTFDDIPRTAIEKARQTLLDTLAVAAGGAETRAAATARTASRTLADPAFLAFWAGVSASALDFDDGHYEGGAIHPASVIIPPLLVLASQQTASVEDILLAQVTAYEVALRAARLAWPEPGGRYHCTGSAGAVGAAVACAKLSGANRDEMERAIAIAWAHAPMAALQFPMVKEAIGWGAHTGYFATQLAMNGFKALPQGVEAPGNPDVFPPTPFDEPQASEDAFTASLGREFQAEFNYLKPYAACRYTHTALESLRELIEEGLEVDEIQSVQVATHGGAQFLTYQAPPSLEHAQYSYPFVLACMAQYGDAGFGQVCEENLTNHELLEFAKKVEVSYDLGLDELFPRHYGTELKVVLRSGESEVRRRLVAPGDVDEPLSEERWRGKIESLLGQGLAAEFDQAVGATGSEAGTKLAQRFLEVLQEQSRDVAA